MKKQFLFYRSNSILKSNVLLYWKYLILILIVFYVTSCSSNDTIGNTTSHGPYYVVSHTGDRTSPISDPIGLEYDNFYVKNSRTIFVGGGDDPNKSYVWITSSMFSGIPPYGYINNAYSYKLNGNNYYGLPVTIPTPGSVLSKTEYAASVNKGTYENDIFNAAYPSVPITITQLPNSYKTLTYDVYQQVGYKGIGRNYSDTESKIQNAFNKFEVTISSSVKNSTLTAENWPNVEFAPLISDNDAVVKAYKIIYPLLSIEEAADQYVTENPNNCLLFYVKDYTGTQTVLGQTYRYYSTSNVYIAKLSVVYIDRMSFIHNSSPNLWRAKEVYHTSIHELTHNWCSSITDNDHIAWHNGDGKDYCSMGVAQYVTNNGIFTGEPTDAYKKVLNNLIMCDGHIQRASNICWELNQYTPLGQLSQNKPIDQSGSYPLNWTQS
jgi:hypothetical protein